MANDLSIQPDAATGASTTTTPAPDDNPFLTQLQTERQQSTTALRASLNGAVQINPDQFAKTKRTADYLGYPIAAVEAMPQTQQQAQVQQVDAATQNAPVTRQAYTNADFAKLAHDDSGTLSSIENALLYAVGGQGTGVGPQGGVQNAVAPSAAGDLLDSVHSFAWKLARAAYTPIGAIPVAYDRAADAITGQDPSNTPASDWYFAHTLAPLDASIASKALPPDATFSRKAVAAVGDLAGTLATLAATGGASAAPEAGLAAQGTGALIRNLFAHTAKTFAPIATSDALGTMQQVYQQTGDLDAATKAAAAQFGTSTLSGMVGLSAEGGLATRLATGFVGGAVSGEASRQAMNMVLPAGMQSQFSADDVALNGLMGMGLGGALGPRAAPAFHDAVRQTYVDSARAAQAEEGAASLQQLSQLATESKLRGRDPATFKATLASMAENPDALQAVYINGEQLENALNQGGVTREDVQRMMPSVADQLGQARATGGDVRIPIEDFATHIAGSPVEAALTPHLKVDPDGMTLQEATQHFEDQKAGLNDQAQQLVDAGTQEDQNATDLQGIHDNILGQLEATGRYRPEVSKAYAALTRDYYGATAERAGMTPAELFAAHPLHIAAETAPGAEQLSQDTTARGAYSPDTNTITALHDADLSTYLHEAGHHFLETHARLAAGDGAPEGIKADVQTFLDHVGEKGTAADFLAKPLDQRRDAHETFARSFEAYLMEGQAPSMDLQGLFSRFRSWLVNVYHSLSSLRVDLSPEVRGVMDRMLASDSAIDEAQRTRAMLPMEQPEGATDKQYQAYVAAGQDATDQAKADMTARSIRDMKWLSNAKSKAMKALQAEGKEARKGIETQVRAAVRDMPVYKAQAELDAKAEAQVEARRQHALALEKETEDARTAAGEKKLKGAKAKEFVAQRMAAWEDAHPEPSEHPTGPELDMTAESHGFANADEMLRSIAEAVPLHEAVQGLTDQRMLQEHGELTDPVSIERAAEAAIHNDARARFMATGLKLLTKSPVSPADLARAAKEAAATAVGGKVVGELQPRLYAAAERRANREMLKAAPKDVDGAVKAQREALLNHQLFRAALDAQTDVAKGLSYLKKFDRDSTRQKIALDIRDQIDDLLDRFDFRKNPSDAPTRAEQNLADWIKAQNDAGYTPSVSAEALDPTVRTPYRELTVEQFRGLLDSVKALEQVGRQRQEIQIEGRKVDLDQFVKEELVPKLQERGQRFGDDDLVDKPEDRHTNPVRIKLAHLAQWLRSARADLKPTEFKRNEYDRHELLGPMGKVFDRVIDANYRKIDMLKGLSNDFAKVAADLGRPWQDSLRESVQNVPLADPDKDGRPMHFTRAKMIGMAIHVGNESNFDKLTKGWGWEPTTVLKFLSDNMTVKDWHAVQNVWDLYEKHWPETQAMYRRLGQTIPEKIAARPFTVTTPDGTEVAMRGGYAAIMYDPLRSRRGEAAANAAAIDPSAELNTASYFRRNTPTNGSMNARIAGYTDRVDLDFHGIARKLQETTHDLAYREALIDTHKILVHPAFRDAFRRAYGREAYESLDQWLGTIANGDAQDNAVRSFGQFLSYTRTGMVINAIAFRATTVLKHGGSAGIKSLGYFAGGGEKYLASRAASMGSDYRAQIAGAIAKFPEIRARLMQQDRDFRSTSHSLFEPEKLISKAERAGHAAVAWADMMTAVPTAWAAYDRAVTEGIPKTQGGTGEPMTEEQAVHYASKIVREAHGSNIETARSNVVNSRNEAIKMFTTLFGFMNTTYGQQLDAFDKIRTAGISNGPVLARTLMAVIVPALYAAYLEHGGPDADKGESLGGWVAKAIGGEVASSVPLVRDAVSMFEGFAHAGQVGAESWLASMVLAAKDGYSAATNPDAKGAIVKDTANAVGMGLHIPGLGQLGTSLQYLKDVHDDKTHPNGALDVTKGVLTGHDGTK